jgi:hypothetical protein
MRLPESVLLEFAPSRSAGIAIGLLGAATMGVILTLPLAAWMQVLSILLVAGWTWSAWRTSALRRGRAACVSLRLAPNRLVAVTLADGRILAGHVRSSSYVSARLTTLVWRADGERRSRHILILPDMVSADAFRRLRVMLRYARNGDVAAAPASHF